MTPHRRRHDPPPMAVVPISLLDAAAVLVRDCMEKPVVGRYWEPSIAPMLDALQAIGRARSMLLAHVEIANGEEPPA